MFIRNKTNEQTTGLGWHRGEMLFVGIVRFDWFLMRDRVCERTAHAINIQKQQNDPSTNYESSNTFSIFSINGIRSRATHFIVQREFNDILAHIEKKIVAVTDSCACDTENHFFRVVACTNIEHDP